MLLYLSPMYIWLTLMLRMAHKEERFLFVIYPLICLGGAVSLALLGEGVTNVLARLTPKRIKVGH